MTTFHSTRSCLAWLAICFTVATPGAFAAEPVRPAMAPVTADMPLPTYAERLVGREAFGVYLAGKKTGWMTIDTRIVEHEGNKCLEEATDFQIQMQFFGETITSKANSAARYALTGDGALVFVQEDEADGENKVSRTATRDGERLKIRTVENGVTTERTAPLPRDTLKSARDLEVWLAAPPKKGETSTIFEVSLGEDDIDQSLSCEFVEATPLVWGGVPIQASRVIVDMDGGKSEMLISPNGRMLRGTMGAILEIRAEEEAIAKALDKEPVDMLAASAILVETPLGDGEEIESLTLDIGGLKDFAFPTSSRQRAELLPDGQVRLTLAREPKDATPAPLTDAERERYLRATPSVQVDREEIRELAAKIVGDESDAVENARRIVAWLNDNLEPTYTANATTATAVLEQRAGDCTEHSLLFTALARAAGIPARQLGGLVYTDHPKPMFAWHAWAEVHDGKGWVSVDPLWQQVRIDPTHIQFSIDDGEDAAWMNVLGAVKIKVHEVKRADD
jgi:hypothetical protein